MDADLKNVTDVDLSVKIGKISLRNPIILASGPKGGKSGEGMKKFAAAGWGAVSTVAPAAPLAAATGTKSNVAVLTWSGLEMPPLG